MLLLLLLVWDDGASAVIKTLSVHHCHNPGVGMSLSGEFHTKVCHRTPVAEKKHIFKIVF